MSTLILTDPKRGLACLYCSTSMQVFGPVFDCEIEDPDDFLDWLKDEDPRDVREIPAYQLDRLVGEWRAMTCEACEEEENR